VTLRVGYQRASATAAHSMENDSPKTAPDDDAALLSMTYAAAKDLALRRFERTYVEALLSACNGNISAAARKAGMDRSNFKRVLRKHRKDAAPAAAAEAVALAAEPEAAAPATTTAEPEVAAAVTEDPRRLAG